jgi:hypothetical protein
VSEKTKRQRQLESQLEIKIMCMKRIIGIEALRLLSGLFPSYIMMFLPHLLLSMDNFF